MQKFYLSINYVDFIDLMEGDDAQMDFTYRQDHIPRVSQNNRRPAIALEATTITIHNTDNPSSTAKNERAWLTNPANTRTASFHIVIDDKEAIEVIPLHEVAWHAGDGSGLKSGNRTSISIEICESGNYGQTLKHATELVANMLVERKWGVERLRRHFDWSGKNCPRLMNSDGKWSGWKQFVQNVNANINQITGGMNSEEEAYRMTVEDANKIIRFLSAAYMATEDKEARIEFNRLANELRRASGQQPSSG